MEEKWIDIEGFEGKYQISTFGRVKSLNFHQIGVAKILKTCKNKRGYETVWLSKNNVKTTARVHRLVAVAFIPNPNNLPDVNHKDENKENNRIDNLEWCTKEYNVKYGTRTLRTSRQFYQYDKNGNFIKKWESGKEIERTLGINRRHIYRCCRGERPTAYGFIWRLGDKGGDNVECFTSERV